MGAVLFGVAAACFLAAAAGAGYVLGREAERREWVRWLKTLKSGTCADQCVRRFHQKNRPLG